MIGDDEIPPHLVLVTLRATAGWSQKRLASALGFRQSHLCDLEKGRGSISPELLARAAALMGHSEEFVREVYELLRKKLRASPARPTSLVSPIKALALHAGEALSLALDQIFGAAAEQATVVVDRAIADRIWQFFTQLPEKTRRRNVEHTGFFWTWAFVERLCHESLAAAADIAQRALELAELAVAVAERVEAPPDWHSRLLGYSWASVANARRVLGDLLGAEQDLGRAKTLWEAGASAASGTLCEARFLEIEAALRRAQRRFPEALTCLASALERAPDPTIEAELYISKGKLLIEMGAHDEALVVLEASIARIPESAPPRLAWVARFNLLVCLCALDRAKEGDACLPGLHRLARELDNGLDGLQLRWLEANVHAANGRKEEAILAFEEVRERFASLGMTYNAALATLDLCVVLLEVGRAQEVKAEAPRLAATFRKLGIERELLAVLTLFCVAAEAERASAEDARRVLELLRKEGTAPRRSGGRSDD